MCCTPLINCKGVPYPSLGCAPGAVQYLLNVIESSFIHFSNSAQLPSGHCGLVCTYGGPHFTRYFPLSHVAHDEAWFVSRVH